MAQQKDPMEVWRDMPVGTFFTIDNEVFKKLPGNMAQYISNPMFGQRQITRLEARRIQIYVPPTNAPAPKVPNVETFETKEVERPAEKPNFGATDITVTPVEERIEQAIQPPADTGKRVKKSKKAKPAPKSTTEETNG